MGCLGASLSLSAQMCVHIQNCLDPKLGTKRVTVLKHWGSDLDPEALVDPPLGTMHTRA